MAEYKEQFDKINELLTNLAVNVKDIQAEQNTIKGELQQVREIAENKQQVGDNIGQSEAHGVDGSALSGIQNPNGGIDTVPTETSSSDNLHRLADLASSLPHRKVDQSSQQTLSFSFASPTQFVDALHHHLLTMCNSLK